MRGTLRGLPRGAGAVTAGRGAGAAAATGSATGSAAESSMPSRQPGDPDTAMGRRVTVSTVVTAAHAPGATAFASMTPRYHAALSFAVRSWVSKSTCTSPQRWVYPRAHSKLSSSDHA